MYRSIIHPSVPDPFIFVNVVLAGDSIFLTALNYRQCAGRAGRRGFDLRGNVLFYGLSWNRIQRLLLSRVPKLGGSFPLTSTMVLRLHNLLHGSDSAKSSVDSVTALLSLPQLAAGSKTAREELLHFVRATIDYLRRAGLMDGKGRPLPLYGLCAHLYPHEPSNMALAHLIRSGLLHEMVRNFDGSAKDRADAMDELVAVLAFLFSRTYRRKQSPETLRELVRKSPSTVVLRNPSAAVLRSLADHHNLITQTFETYALNYATQYQAKLGSDWTLPLSRFGVGKNPNASSPSTYPTIEQVAANPLRVVGRSPFVASSGLTDSFETVFELADTARAGLNLNASAVPSLAFLSSDEHVLDAFVYDFWKHGQIDPLVKINGIRRGDVWYKVRAEMLHLSNLV